MLLLGVIREVPLKVDGAMIGRASHPFEFQWTLRAGEPPTARREWCSDRHLDYGLSRRVD